MAGIAFEIHLDGVVDDATLDRLGDVDATTTGASTVLTGEATDQAELIGLLKRLRAEHLRIAEVRRNG